MRKINKLIDRLILFCKTGKNSNFIKKTDKQLIISQEENSFVTNIIIILFYFFLPFIFISLLLLALPLIHMGTIFIIFLILLWPYEFYRIAKANNRVVINFEQQDIVISNLDFFCKRILKERTVQFHEIQHLIKKKMKFSKSGNPFRLLLEIEGEKIVLIDIGNEFVAEKLFDIISLILEKK